jgi:hypothetical protein
MGDKENRGNQCANILPHLKDEKDENVKKNNTNTDCQGAGGDVLVEGFRLGHGGSNQAGGWCPMARRI